MASRPTIEEIVDPEDLEKHQLVEDMADAGAFGKDSLILNPAPMTRLDIADGYDNQAEAIYYAEKVRRLKNFRIGRARSGKYVIIKAEDVDATLASIGETRVVSERKLEKLARQVASAPRAAASGLIPLATLCQELKIEPKEARVKLRSAKYPKPEGGWNFTKEQVDAVKTIITAIV
jgi:hypothetical protein